MTIQLNKNFTIRTGLALALALAIWSPSQAQSSEPAKAKNTKMDHSRMDHSQMEHSKMMMDHCQKMVADMKAQDAELAQLVARMNSATEAKVDRMAEIITHMAKQRADMNKTMGDFFLRTITP